MKKAVCLILVIVLAFSLSACTVEINKDKGENVIVHDGDKIGTGSKSFNLKITDYDGKTVSAQINTDCKTVGEALYQLKIIDGDQGAYGIYIKKVNGIRADYDLDGKYWAFYVEGEYSNVGADSVEIVPDGNYTLAVKE